MGKLFDKIRRVQDKTRPFCSAIVPAAGSSTRMGGQDKLLTEMGANTTRTILASKNSDADQVVYEMGDLWYHCLVLLAYHNITPGEMLVEMAGRKVEEEK